MISDIINFLKTHYDGDGYFAQEFDNEIFFGVDKNENIICLKKVHEKLETTKIRTNYLELFQNHKVTIKLENEMLTDYFNVIVCSNKENENIETFVRLCLCYLKDNNNNEMLNLMKNLIELFQITSLKNSDYEKGLWGELFTIYYLINKFRIDISSYWHNDFYLKYDFSLSDQTKLEVKTTSNSTRIHRVNHEQVFTNNNVILSSVMIRKDDSGLTVFDLFENVKTLFTNDYNKIVKYEKMLRKINEEEAERFELNYANDNIKMYKVASIPKFEMKEPEGVYRTEYDIDLSNIESLTDDEISIFFNEAIKND